MVRRYFANGGYRAQQVALSLEARMLIVVIVDGLEQTRAFFTQYFDAALQGFADDLGRLRNLCLL